MQWDDCEIAYGVTPCRWPLSSDGRIHVQFLLNPSGRAFSRMTVSQLKGAVEAAMRSWEEANPRIDLELVGLTEKPPSTVVGRPLGRIPEPVRPVLSAAAPNGAMWFDGYNVIGWLPEPPNEAAFQAAGQMGGLPGVETDIAVYAALWKYGWYPCHRSCPDLFVPFGDPLEELTVPGFQVMYQSPPDLQQLLTHELGHALGLMHPLVANCTLSMSTGCDVPDAETRSRSGRSPIDDRWVTRYRSTPGVGDILGLKALYPWNCASVRAVSRKPGTKRVRVTYPKSYRYLCPGIQIGTP